MKKYLLILCAILLVSAAEAQNQTKKFSFTAGGGSQFYKGDLGCGIYKFKPAHYGSVNVSAGISLNKSFDGGLLGFIGDYGYCQPEEVANKEVPASEQCPGCIGRPGMGNLNARLSSGGIFLQYKIANGYLLAEKSRIKPHLTSAIVYNHVADHMKRNCVCYGNYYSLNSSAGLRYYFTGKVSMGWDFTVGYFLNDKVDFIERGANDMYVQNTFSIGIDL